ncbi:MAG: chorismate mutase [Proteobacteria bacterium]|nr:chorismate mutase [Pseudomonadota bacterium]
MEEIKKLRERINKIDQAIIQKLATREKIVRKIGLFKAAKKKDIQDVAREKKLLHFYNKLCKQYQLDQVYVNQIFKLIISHSKKLQKNV